ncbi:hypothetical protein Taro_000293 [Colocasia esculenta]|uniref:Uncharacterized protein n=1 Tax=Colocasia esculenta TaxID=4460 RepID=A0A843TEJ2_COLES|nr:hypothetical protein [Colocasia esculenta]
MLLKSPEGWKRELSAEESEGEEAPERFYVRFLNFPGASQTLGNTSSSIDSMRIQILKAAISVKLSFNIF